jgi:cytochrome c-type biogenesis protein CcmH/NrfG
VTPAAVGQDPDARAELEEERDFLLRSLDDLEAERAAGELDDHDYRNLKDGYTARAAEVLRALDEHRAVRDRAAADAPAGPRWRRPVAVLVVLALAVGAGLTVAAAAGSRKPGETATGGTGSTAASSRLTEAARVARDDPRRALDLYDAVIKDDNRNVEAWAERALLLASLGVGINQPGLLDEAHRSIDTALKLEPQSPRSRFYLGLIEQFTGDRPAAEAAFEQALADDPPPPLRSAIEQRLAELRAPPAPSSTTTTPP